MDLLAGKKILQKGEIPVSADSVLKKKILILFYFTVLDSEACRHFDLKLRDVYTEATLRKVELGVVIVPSDTDKESSALNIKNNYMDWYSVTLEDDLGSTLSYYYGVTHAPTLIVVKKDGTLVSREGVKDIEDLGINVLVSWT